MVVSKGSGNKLSVLNRGRLLLFAQRCLSLGLSVVGPLAVLSPSMTPCNQPRDFVAISVSFSVPSKAF